MERILDIVPLRSLVAVDEHGGFQRAAAQLHLSQGGVSQHVRRLEAAVGRPLVERHGRGSRFTADGERLLVRARQLLTLHDEIVRDLATPVHRDLVVGSTEHAASRLLPALSAALERSASGLRFRYRIDRGARLREGLASGQVDLALLLTSAGDPRAVPVGPLPLTWYSSPDWQLPTSPDPVPVVAFDQPCELRKRALETLAAHGVPAVVGAEATQLAGVQAAVGAGLGVALLATSEPPPAGLVARHDLPTPEPLTLHVCPRPGLDDEVVRITAAAVEPLLGAATLAPA